MTDKRKDFFDALYAVATVVNASLDPRKVLNTVVENVVDAMDVKASSIRVLNRNRTQLLMGAANGLSRGYVHKGPVLVEESGIDRRALAGEPIYLKDAQTDPDFQYRNWAQEERIHSVLVVPLKNNEDRVIGVLRAYTDETRGFTLDETRFLQASANLTATALENARLHQALRSEYDILLENFYRLDDV